MKTITLKEFAEKLFELCTMEEVIEFIENENSIIKFREHETAISMNLGKVSSKRVANAVNSCIDIENKDNTRKLKNHLKQLLDNR